MSTNNHFKDRTSLMNVLWDIQKKRRYINDDDVSKIATAFNISEIELEGVISFYHFFHRKDAGKYTIYLNNSIVSKCKQYDEVKTAFEDVLGIKTGNVTEDKMFGLFSTSCIGLSDQETSALINYYPFTNLNAVKARSIISKIKEGHSLKSICNYPNNNIKYKPRDAGRTVFFKPFKIGEALKTAISIHPEEVIQKIKDSKLSGRGGAFFPTGSKWQFCRNNESDQKYIICNADEGEPGTFKDRVLLSSQPEMLIEGMAIAGYAVGATKGFIYLRAEYAYLKQRIQEAIETYRQQGLLGNDILGAEGFNFSIHIFLGAGAYICGEETALIASMEGKRGEPTTKEFFPVERGYLGRPTVVNNVETLCAVPRILNMELEHYLAIGTAATPGTKLLSVSGDCEKPGIYEIEWGMKLRDFLNLIGAKNPNMILYNGFAGECLSAADFDREISGENLLAEHIQFKFKDPIEYAQKMSAIGLRSGGSFMVFNEDRDVLSILQNITDFFIAESCGICVPCRTGNFLLSRKISKLKAGNGIKSDLEDAKEWGQIIKQSSRCGLGKTSTNCLLSAMLKFPDVFETQLQAESHFSHDFEVESASTDYDDFVNEIQNSYD